MSEGNRAGVRGQRGQGGIRPQEEGYFILITIGKCQMAVDPRGVGPETHPPRVHFPLYFRAESSQIISFIAAIYDIVFCREDRKII